MNIKDKQNTIYELLKSDPTLRDNDNKLLAGLWELEFAFNGLDINQFSASGFLDLLEDGHFSKPEAITRCRRKLQELHPELRGQKYYQRHQHQTEVIDQVRNF